VKLGLQHNIGLGGACVVALYRKYNEKRRSQERTNDPDLLEQLERQEAKL
jgi:sterol carrier protein 2